jgi:restriction endonuclease
MINEQQQIELENGITSNEERTRIEGTSTRFEATIDNGSNRENEAKREESYKIKAEDVSPEDAKSLEIFVAEMNKRNIPSFDGIQIKKNYPKAYKALWDFIEEKGAYQGQLDDGTMIGILAYTSRMITFDFFDSQNMFVLISGAKNKWRYEIYYNDQKNLVDSFSQSFSNRTEAEVAGFLKAFELLENQLK